MSAIKHWRWQRYSAFALVLLLPWTIYDLSMMYQAGGFSSEHISSWLSQPIKGLLILITFTIALYHAQLGVEVIAEDYIPNVSKQLAVILLNRVVIIVCWVLLCFALLSNLSL